MLQINLENLKKKSRTFNFDKHTYLDKQSGIDFTIVIKIGIDPLVWEQKL